MTTKTILKSILPPPARRWLRWQLSAERFLRRFKSDADLASLRGTVPVNPADFGESRGQCIDRYYIEKFLAAHAEEVGGRVLEFDGDAYARRFGGHRVSHVEVLHLSAGNSRAASVADWAHADAVPSDSFECILCTQVLHRVYDCSAAVRTFFRILKPGGVVLATAPGIQKMGGGDLNKGEDCWRFTSLACRRLFEEAFPRNAVDVKAYGNVMAAVAFLHGFAVEDVGREDLDYRDEDFEVSIAVRAVKPLAASIK